MEIEIEKDKERNILKQKELVTEQENKRNLSTQNERTSDNMSLD